MDKSVQNGAADILQQGYLDVPAERAAEYNCFPLSFAQERLWFLHQAVLCGRAYNIAGAVRLKGELCTPALEQALQEIIRRHETLRTSFPTIEGRPFQRIHERIDFALQEEDLRDSGSAEVVEQRLARALEIAAKWRFDLSKPELARISLLRIGDQEYVLTLVMHHIIADGWSIGILIRELKDLYGAFSSGRPSPLPELEIQYVDYSAWQRELFESGELKEGLAYWKQQLDGAPALLEILPDSPRKAAHTSGGSSVQVPVSRELIAKLKDLSLKTGTTLYMVLLAGFQTVLWRYTGQKDVVVGSPVAERPQIETEPLIGLFVNFVARRTQIDPNKNFLTLLQAVRQSILNGQPYQYVPFEKVVEALEQERVFAQMPVVQVAFAWQSGLYKTISLGEATGRSQALETGTAKFDVTLMLEEEEDGEVQGWLEYCTDLFWSDTARQIAFHYVRLLEEAAAHPDLPIANLQWMSADEQKELIAWNRTKAPYPQETSLTRLFEEAARSRGDAVAVTWRDETLTYAGLNAKANQLANYLKSLGVGPEVMVGICMERSPAMMIGILGILKAGGCYVPLDANYPQERLQFMMEDAGIRVLLSDEKVRDRLPEAAGKTICLEETGRLIDLESTANLQSSAHGENLAYVMYTSGSTGKPKGVGVTHRNIIRLVRNTDYAEFADSETFLQFAPISFDASTFEIWGAMLNGGKLALFSGDVYSLEDLKENLSRHAVTTLWLTAGLFHLVAEEQIDSLSGVRQLLAGGDVLRPAVVKRVLDSLLDCRLINGYGPTEGTTFSCCYSVDRSEDIRTSVPIGRAIANTQAYVLDEWMQPVPVGVPGELYIGGDGLARGYWNRPDLTAERFIPDSVSGEAGRRLYRTGDRARHLRDGNIEFLGRADTQVKIRGFRVEVEEIEDVLRQQPGVRHCAVTVKESASGEKRLVAYVVPQDQALPGNSTQLREYLKGKLPEYMVPAIFLWLEHLPLSPNGKLDRKSLPEPQTAEIESAGSDDTPLTVTEEKVRAVWSSVLDIGEIRRSENFFELGGHSLAASRAVLELRRIFKCAIPVSIIFEFPTLQGLSTQIESLVLQGPAPVPGFSRKLGRPNLLPLSPAQEGLWFLAQMMPKHVYNIAGTIQLNGELDKIALERSLQEIVRRHEILRTAFVEVDDRPVQRIHPEVDLKLEQTDLRWPGTPENAEEELRRELREEATRPFELSRPGLLRARLFQVGEHQHVLALVMHHIIADGWSVGLTMEELTGLYGAFSQGRFSTLPELEIQYGDQVIWQQELMSNGALETGLEFWKRELTGAPVLLELPADSSRPPAPSYSGASHEIRFDQDLGRSVATMARREGLTPYMLLLAAFHVLLSRYSGAHDVVVGSPMEARLPETEKLIGLFVNIVALRAQVDEADSFIQFARKVRQTVQQAKAYQEIPFGKVVRELADGRVLSPVPLVQAVFAWQAGLPRTLTLGKVQGIVLPIDTGTSKFDLTMTMEEDAGQIRGSIEYSTEIFSLDTVRRMADGYVRLVRSAMSAPDAAIRHMQLMSDEEELQARTWSSGTIAPAPASTVLDLFAAQVKKHPESTAVECMGRRLSYAQLDRRANQLARHLRQQGAREESVVGIFMRRTAEIVVAMLGVLKAGAMYVPLDPSYPDERLRYMLEDAEVWLLCTEEQMLARVQGINCAKIIVGEENELLSTTEASAFLTTPAQETPAYIIYTSGSTGHPKGVQVTHGGLHNLCFWHRRAFALGPADRTTQIASLGFDASVWEIWSALSAGATLCFVPEEIRSSPPELQHWLLDQGINASFLPTPLAEELIRLPWPEPSSLRTLLTGGDKLHPAPGPRLPFSLVNNYGPTECAVVATSGVVEPAQHEKAPPIGRAIDNAQVYVLDGELRTIPCGVAGEVYIGGEGLARGYWRRPDLTAERFIPNPLSGMAGARLYRTGDRARYLPDGQLEFLGRLDHQVKLRGHRIELEEIASVLRRFEGVRDAVAAVLGDPKQGTERLVAYVAHDQAPVTQNQLLQFARRQLPPYMVPSTFVLLDRLPLNASGKVDRKALPEPETNVLELVSGGLPLNPVEELVAGVWKNVLNAGSVCRGSNFFELGGHSLLATRMIAQLRQLFNSDLPLRLAFEFPVLGDLAAQIEACKQQTSQSEAIPHTSRQEGLRLSPAQRRLWLIDQIIPNQSAYNIPGAVRLQGKLNEEALEQSLREIIRRHEVLRTSFVQNDRTPLQQVHDTVDFELQKTDLERMMGGTVDEETLRRAIEEEILRPFVLSAPELIRVRLLRLAKNDHVLVVVMHHIVADGWSVGVLIHELKQLYGACCQGKASPLPKLEIQYADYAAWQDSLAGSGRLQHELEYWKTQLSGLPPVSDLPTDYPRPAVQSFTGATEEWRLSEKLTADLKDLGQRHGVTLFMTLLAGLQILLSRYTSQKDVVVGSPIANRPRAELQGLIGFFINMLVLRADLSDDPTVEQALRRTREMCLQAYAHQDLPFEKLVEELDPQRDLGRNPLFQVMLAFESTPDEFLQFPGMEVSLVPLPDKTAKFDLSFVMADRPDGIHGTVQYCTDLFAQETIRRMIEHYEQILTEIVSHPAEKISKLSLLTARDWNLWETWNQTETPWSAEENIVRMIERQARSEPAAIAVEFEGREMTYEELNQRANQLARYLRKQGVSVDGRIVLCMERSMEMVIGILAVLKAGCAYVPIDEGYPEDRVKYMLEDAGARTVLTQQTVHQRFLGLAAEGVHWFSLDSQWDEIARERTDNLGLEIDGANLAYMIYTSGSTGLPKGAMNTHSGLRNRLLWMQQAYGLTRQDRVLQKTPFSFDVSVWEFLWPLMMGARLVVARPGGHRDAGYLVEKLRASQITTLHFVPSMLRAFVQAEGVESCTAVRRVIVSGEALPPDLVDQWESRHKAGLHNLYGPTEASIDVSFWPCSEKRPWGIPIGCPIANTQLYVVDDQGELAPPGVVGELYIGGVGLGRGYWNRAALTAEKFVPDAFSGKHGSRLYRTGDRARCRRDGVLEYLGRNDEQVKIRGYRIELGEIEVALRQQPEIAGAAVLVKEEGSGNKRLVAYMVPTKTGNHQSREWLEELQGRLKSKLPDYMVPTAWVELESLPLNPNGKLDRKALLKIETPRNQVKSKFSLPQNNTERVIADVWKGVLGMAEIGVEENFFDIGGHSLSLAEVHRGLREKFEASLQLVELFQYPTIRGLAARLEGTQRTNIVVSAVKTAASPSTANTEIAIIGMACRLPGAENIDAFWANLQAGVESIAEFSDEELRLAGVEKELLSSPNYVRRGAVLKDIEWFDARFFNFSAREAEMTDPQHRVLLECAWEALENAGYNADRHSGKIGVFAGSFASTYFMNLYSNPEVMKTADGFSLFFANGNDFLATRLSYKLNLTGPSMTVQCGCSTSLVALHMACRSLLDGECDMALAGGVAVKVPQKSGYYYQEGGIFSPDGHCRSFDARAQGTIGGNGAGIVVVKRLQDALRDRDCIYGVIKGSAINNDGSDKVGYTAPGVNGQRDVILEAHRRAAIDPETISYIEAHGTGTALGDPVEITALTQAFRARTSKNSFCAIGSVKSNLGHLDTAAGVAGVIKTVLALQHGAIPPSLHFEKPNPKIDFANSPFYVNTALAEWRTGATPRRAGISSFGIGGTNVHVILEEAPVTHSMSSCRPWQLVVLSAKSAAALETMTDNLGNFLEHRCTGSLADAAHTLQVGRKEFPRRRFLVSQGLRDAAVALQTREPQIVHSSGPADKQRRVSFLFPGQGSQYAGMGRELYAQEALFREQVDHCADILRKDLGFDLRKVLYPATEKQEWASAEISETRVTQPALFVIEYALARLWMSWGVVPETMLGHSIGEYVAACLAGVFSLEDALRIVARRGRLMQSCPRGAMLAVAAGEDQVHLFLDRLDLAAVNGPKGCVLAGPIDALSGVEQELAEQKIASRRLPSSHAFHSRMMDPVIAEFVSEVRRIKLNSPAMPYLSCLTGEMITGAQATDPEYYGRQLRGTVQFAKGITALCTGDDRLTLEVGPGHSASTAVRQTVSGAPLPFILNSLPKAGTAESEQKHILTALGQLWLHGVAINWNGFAAGEEWKRVSLPTYPFERQRYWIEPSSAPRGSSQADTYRNELQQWLYVPQWKEAQLGCSKNAAPTETCVLVLGDGEGLAATLESRLQEKGYEVVTAVPGQEFARIEKSVYQLRPQAKTDYEALLSELREQGRPPAKIVHFWNTRATFAADPRLEIEEDADFAFHTLLSLAQALATQDLKQPLHCLVVASGLHEISGSERLRPGRGALLGLSKVIARELPNVICSTVDLESQLSSRVERFVLDHLVAECEAFPQSSTLGYRGTRRWLQTFAPVNLEAAPDMPDVVEAGGVYLITGGLSGIGFEIAAWLAGSAQASLVLVDRVSFPPEDEWDQWLEDCSAGDPIADKIRKFRSWETQGARVMVCNADVTDRAEIKEVRNLVKARFGKVDGLVHAAGMKGVGRIASKTRETTEIVLAPKIKGTLVLDEVFAEDDLKFIVLCSSLTAVAGQIGQADYAAANAFLDSFAAFSFFRDRCSVVSLNWDSWREDAVPESHAGIKAAEGVEALRRVLAMKTGPQAVLSVHTLETVLRPPASETTPETFVSGRTYGRTDFEKPISPPSNATETLLVQIWTEVLGISPIGVDDNFFELGGDSLIALKMIARAQELGLGVTVEQLFKMPAIRQLVSAISVVEPAVAKEPEECEVPLLPLQEDILNGKGPGARSALLLLHDGADTSKLAAVFAAIAANHDALRLRFWRTEDGWKQKVVPLEQCQPFLERQLDEGIDLDQPSIQESVLQGVQLNPGGEEDVFQCVLFRTSTRNYIYLQVLDLVSDSLSLSLLLAELEARYGREVGIVAAEPRANAGFQRWRSAIARRARTTSPQERGRPAKWAGHAAARLPVDFRGGLNSRSSVDFHTVSLSKEQSRPFVEVLPAKFHCGPEAVLLTGLSQVFSRWSGSRHVVFDTILDGRTIALETPLDVKSAIGCFSADVRVGLSAEKFSKGPSALKSVKERLREASNRALVRKLLGSPASPGDDDGCSGAETRFLYVGGCAEEPGAPFAQMVRSRWHESSSLEGQREYLIEIIVSLNDGALSFAWAYSRHLYRPETIQRLAEMHVESLRALALACGSESVATYSPSDFPEAQLSQRDLDSLMAQIAGVER